MPQKPLKVSKKIDKKAQTANRHGKVPQTKIGGCAAQGGKFACSCVSGQWTAHAVLGLYAGNHRQLGPGSQEGQGAVGVQG